MNILRTLSRSRPAWRLVALMALLLAALTLSASPALAQSPPGPVGSVSVSRSDGSLTASWSASARATSYHVTYSVDNGRSWSLAALNHSGTSITIGAKNSATYIVGVRARNSAGDSGWVNSASSGPFTPPPPPPTPPSPVSYVTITRADGTVTASWPAVARATKYHVTYTDNRGGSYPPVDGHDSWTSTSITFSADNAQTYSVGVRAGNSAGWSAWRDSRTIGPYYPPPAVPSNLRAYGNVQSVVLVWDNPQDSGIYYYEYQYRADSDAGFGAWTTTGKGSGGITSYSVTGLTNGTKYHFKLRAVGSGGPSASTSGVSATPRDGVTIPKPQPGIQPPERPASVTLTRADGTLTADWNDVKRATSYHVTYSDDNGASWTLAASKHTQSDITITGVSDTATYVVGVRGHNAAGYGQWRNSAPIAPLASTVSVSNLGETGINLFDVGQFGSNNYKLAGSFTTGSSSNGYTMESATARVARVVSSAATLSMAVHANSSGNPAAQATHTLTGTSPTTAGDVTYTCSGSCSLNASTTYFLVISATGNLYQMRLTDSGGETNSPSDAGWSIADVSKRKTNNNAWVNYPVHSDLATMFKVTATEK